MAAGLLQRADRGGDGAAPPRTARRDGWTVNNKRVQRLWRDEGLKVPYRKRKKPHRGIGTAVGAMCPDRARTRCGRSTSSSTTPSTAAP